MASDFTVTLLGTGHPAPLLNRFGPSTLVEAGETKLLFDCGRGTMQRLYQINHDASEYNKLFLTHLHSDHTTGIPDLWITGRLLNRTETPLRIWGQKGTKHMIHHLQKAFEIDTMVRSSARVHDGVEWQVDGFNIEVNEFDEGYIYEEDNVRVIPFKVPHHKGSDVPSYGFRVEYNGYILVISGDTSYSENLVKYSEGVDLLIHEVAAAPLDEEIPEGIEFVLSYHTVPEECGRIFSQVLPKLAVYNHILLFMGVSLDEVLERTRKEYDGSVVVGEDMMKIQIGETVQVINR